MYLLHQDCVNMWLIDVFASSLFLHITGGVWHQGIHNCTSGIGYLGNTVNGIY